MNLLSPDILAFYASHGMTRRETADELGVQYSRISTVAKAAGIRFPRQAGTGKHGRNGKVTTRHDQIVALYQSGKTLQEIGDTFGVTRERIRQILRVNSVPAIEGGATVRREKVRARKVSAAEQQCLRVSDEAFHSAQIAGLRASTGNSGRSNRPLDQDG